CEKDDFKKTQDQDAYLNCKFLYKSSNIQSPVTAPIALPQNPDIVQILVQIHVLIGNLILLAEQAPLMLDNTPLSPI
ncbi:21229_t:CDS:1, partial [Racocetra persica]